VIKNSIEPPWVIGSIVYLASEIGEKLGMPVPHT
jgi:hypothetical protein